MVVGAVPGVGVVEDRSVDDGRIRIKIRSKRGVVGVLFEERVKVIYLNPEEAIALGKKIASHGRTARKQLTPVTTTRRRRKRKIR